MFLTIREFCTAYGVGRTRAYALINQGAVEAVKIDASTRITGASAEAWAATLPRVKAKSAPRSGAP
ncbi:MAG TPA: excisionase [Hyphomonadaceae bacterium]|nr:excisionase [Hyphomonadaceae bacterium]